MPPEVTPLVPTPGLLDFAWLCITAALAGGVNALAGGGTLLTFPALFAALGPANSVMANGTSTVALAPASFSSAWAYRKELAKEWRWLILLIAPSLVGGVIGTLLVTRLPDSYFKALIPWLILLASSLFALQPLLARKKGDLPATGAEPAPPKHSIGKLVLIVFFQLAIAIYGGYFGAGIGILMLTGLGLMGLKNMHEMNALKTVLAGCINGMSVGIFVWEGKVNWPIALMMMVTSIIGGYLAASFGRRLKPIYIRYFVIAMGFILSAWFFYGQWRQANEPVEVPAIQATPREYSR
ncbi:sulfite exporter TauE/SafE family protein [Anatilimnocola sp. NA78]|uniref:sulfite exporter TauE/SafE family protein n=1 Tax=Anatilimnocola sp. NA78 TaxID=3415683 RepID=UPI003CE598D3